ncbi:MAG: DUF4124 domain-containing protein [Pseudomonadota bacterium]
MKHLATLSLTLAALAAAPAALAGSDILKCVDGAGNVTLTDQPCESGARATRMSVASPSSSPSGSPAAQDADPAIVDAAPAAEAHPMAVQRFAASPRMQQQHDWRPRMPPRDRPLARDVATLKAARAQLLLSDADRTRLVTSR